MNDSSALSDIVARHLKVPSDDIVLSLRNGVWLIKFNFSERTPKPLRELLSSGKGYSALRDVLRWTMTWVNTPKR